MKILVCITHVPDTTAKISFVEDNTKFDSTNVQFIIGPYDDYALARAVELKEEHGGEITVLSVDSEVADPSIRKALAIGADKAIRINAIPTDSVFVAEQIYNHAKDENYDLILMGRETIDFNGGIVHAMVAEMLGIASVSPVMRLDISGDVASMDCEVEGGKQVVETNLPFVAGCQEPIAEWKIPAVRGIMQARMKPLTVVEPNGESVSKSISFELPVPKGACKMVDADNVAELVNLLKNEAKVL